MEGQRPLFPMFVSLRDKLCVIAGAGTVALRRCVVLLACGAKVRVIAPIFHEGFAALDIERREGYFSEADLDGAFLAVAATNDPAVNARVVRACQERGVWVCSAHRESGLRQMLEGGKNLFVFPALAYSGAVSVGVSSAGRPALTRWLRERIASFLPRWIMRNKA